MNNKQLKKFAKIYKSYGSSYDHAYASERKYNFNLVMTQILSEEEFQKYLKFILAIS
jgi:hypothetical protein